MFEMVVNKPLIELYQNVNEDDYSFRDIIGYPLIELYQNVNKNHRSGKKTVKDSFNRTILECKYMGEIGFGMWCASFNRTILECKSF